MNDSFGARDMRTKYGNRRVTEDGYVFDSVAERNHYLGLKLLKPGRPGQALLKQKLEKKSSRPPASGKRAVAQEVAA